MCRHSVTPVSVPGGLFYLGVVHPAQGDGKILGTGIETSAEIEFSVQVVNGKPIGWPRGSNSTEIFTIGNARPLRQRCSTPLPGCLTGSCETTVSMKLRRAT
jgi:acetamidase/formamidase